jgi:hypothetical protein
MHDLLCSAAVQRRAILNPVVLVAVLPVAAGLVETLRRAWVCDDAFISFRYVDHLLRGHGLVFNPGERVEGYTHFLWVILLAACNRLGFDLVELGRYLPILFFAATLFVLTQRSWRLRAGAWTGLPIAAWCLALHHDAQLFASSGLETAPFGLLLVLGLLAATATAPRVGLAGALYALATLMRPEGALYTATAGAFLLWRARAVRPIAVFSATWIALVALFVSQVESQNNPAIVLEIDPSVRDAGMGGAAAASFWTNGEASWCNPALLGSVRGIGYDYSHERYELSIFPDGDFLGTPEDAFQASAAAYLQ